MKIFIGKLANSVTSDVLGSWFEDFGRVTSAAIATNPRTGQPRGFGFVEMPNNRHALEAIAALNGCEWEGKTIYVAEGESNKQKRPQRDERECTGDWRAKLAQAVRNGSEA
jgi:RNA recognition motif-containing protein